MNLVKRIFLLAVFLPVFVSAQEKNKPLPNWQNLDLQADGVFGVSAEKAHAELLKGKQGVPVIVAVIDGGVEADHEDLKSVMWKNKGEIAGNGIDDDKNGYIDDVFGWNFLGSAKENVRYDNLEMVRLIRKYQDKYASVVNSTPLSREERKEFNLYKKMVTDYMGRMENARMGYENLSIIVRNLEAIEKAMGVEKPTAKHFDDFKTKDDTQEKVLKLIRSELKKEPDYAKVRQEIMDTYRYYSQMLNYNLNIDFDPRDSIGDDYNNGRERYYGNGDAAGPDADHGTHVAGIIAADRNNGTGIKGVANNVLIMSVRAVPDGDERDKDVANSIFYAVDNGAKVINMSFGKGYSWDKALVDSAVRYAESKDVLLVHAAGNDSKNIDEENSFPTRFYGDSINPNYWGMNRRIKLPAGAQNRPMMGGRMTPPQFEADTVKFTMPQAANWIEVGASHWKNDDGLVATFSNFGKRNVDVFAPGVKINSTVPGSKYKENDGTSMAAPVVSGVAALIRSYYPQLTAVQVKEAIVKSVTKVEQKVKIRVEGSTKRVPFSEVCSSGGIVNAYKALQLAAQMQQSLASGR